jgi:hypothetical protein
LMESPSDCEGIWVSPRDFVVASFLVATQGRRSDLFREAGKCFFLLPRGGFLTKKARVWQGLMLSFTATCRASSKEVSNITRFLTQDPGVRWPILWSPSMSLTISRTLL